MNPHDKGMDAFIKAMKASSGVQGLSEDQEKALEEVLRDALESANIEIEELEYLAEEAEMFEKIAAEETQALLTRLGL